MTYNIPDQEIRLNNKKSVIIETNRDDLTKSIQ